MVLVRDRLLLSMAESSESSLVSERLPLISAAGTAASAVATTSKRNAPKTTCGFRALRVHDGHRVELHRACSSARESASCPPSCRPRYPRGSATPCCRAPPSSCLHPVQQRRQHASPHSPAVVCGAISGVCVSTARTFLTSCCCWLVPQSAAHKSSQVIHQPSNVVLSEANRPSVVVLSVDASSPSVASSGPSPSSSSSSDVCTDSELLLSPRSSAAGLLLFFLLLPLPLPLPLLGGVLADELLSLSCADGSRKRDRCAGLCEARSRGTVLRIDASRARLLHGHAQSALARAQTSFRLTLSSP